MTRSALQPWISSAIAPRILLAVGLFAIAAAPAPADDAACVAKAREVLAKHADAVVRVTATLQQDMAGFGVQLGGMGGEQKGTAVGTVVDPSGIVVLATAELNPTAAMMADGLEVNVDGEQKKIKLKTKISQPVIHLADGTEVPARIAIEDADTGLTYVVPEKKAVKPFASLPPGPEAGPRVLDDVILLSRLAKHSGEEPSVILTRISAVVTKPRRGYAVGGANGAAFDRDGRFFGVATLRTEPTAGIGGSFMPLVIPAADIAQVAAQVREQGEPAGK